MLYLADENFNGDILRGVIRQCPALDVVRVQDVGLSGASDPQILEWAAGAGRIIMTHDVSTLVGVRMNALWVAFHCQAS